MASDANLEELYKPIDLEICRELLAIKPEHWWSIWLDVDRVPNPGIDGQFAFSIRNDEGDPDCVLPSNEIYSLVREHATIFATHATAWRRLTYHLSFNEADEDWSFSVDYEY